MPHGIHRVRRFEIVGPYTIKVEFEDGVSQTIDLLPILRGELFGPLRDRALFDCVRLDPEVHTLVWPNGADLDPATLHDWADVGSEMAALAQRWESQQAAAARR
ncbi:MAG: DUF2442 domain-containing protein [Actinomycetota bacterium]